MPVFQGADSSKEFFSMMLKQPQMRHSAHFDCRALTSGPSSVHMMSGEVDMLRPCSMYSGKTIMSMSG